MACSILGLVIILCHTIVSCCKGAQATYSIGLFDMSCIGTAGHIDHGKSALVKALTGIDPDRLAEDRGAILEERRDARGRALGRSTCRGQLRGTG